MVKCYIIAEAGVNHNGDLELARRLIDVAAEAGADAVKFQTFRTESVVTKQAATAEYQASATAQKTQEEMIRPLELSFDQFRELKQYCARHPRLEFLSTPFDNESLDFLMQLGMPILKIASGEVTNHDFLVRCATYDRPIILSTGMCDLAEVKAAVQVIADARRDRGFKAPLGERLQLLHCTSNYPTKPEDLNLRAIATLAAETGLRAGLSDHSLGITASLGAVAMGAAVIEKHFTLDNNLSGPDHQASLNPGELARLVAEVRVLELSLGDGIKLPRPSELPVRDLVRRSVCSLGALAAGEVLTAGKLCLLRPGTGIPPSGLPALIGRRTRVAIPAGTMLSPDQLQL
jgi:N,N'-diacetyllegionaminate synthase